MTKSLLGIVLLSLSIFFCGCIRKKRVFTAHKQQVKQTKDLTFPAPRKIVAQKKGNQVIMTWELDRCDYHLSHYEIYRFVEKSFPPRNPQKIIKENDTTYIDNIDENTTHTMYYYCLTPVWRKADETNVRGPSAYTTVDIANN